MVSVFFHRNGPQSDMLDKKANGFGAFSLFLTLRNEKKVCILFAKSEFCTIFAHESVCHKTDEGEKTKQTISHGDGFRPDAACLSTSESGDDSICHR